MKQEKSIGSFTYRKHDSKMLLSSKSGSSLNDRTQTSNYSMYSKGSMMSHRSSIATRAQTANESVDSKPLLGVGAVICGTIALVYPLVYCTVEYGIFGGNTEWPAYRNEEDDSSQEYTLRMTESVPVSNLTDAQFQVYIAFVMWMTMVLTGLGLEVLVWLSFLQGHWTREMETYWRVAQFVFPLWVATAVGLAMTHNYLALPIMVFSMWKFGFPETILYIYNGLYNKKHSKFQRVVDLINGIGTVIHHSTSSLYVAVIVTGALPAHRAVIQVSLPLLMQHWFVLLKYYNTWAYVALQLILEAWFEWTILSSLEVVHNLHWTGGVLVGAMIFAHWLYLVAGGLSLFVTEEEDTQVIGTDVDHFLKYVTSSVFDKL
eukprot:CAMPEP_0172454616 /NCGR_PEP_ID=MMETSP1065-20121228/11550_1 /TAXON_ID=265537 /ORGANISM="Amphiprora paludosa, Strain CCMP125" /LENGTH=373 /DNA_ID=CAMNT_0013206967 /DNA_START=218 /DNA_END=1335 /DNA_ORIENTATION=-